MKFNKYIYESNIKSIGKSLFSDLQKLSPDKVKKVLKSNFNQFIKIVKDNDLEQEVLDIINKRSKKRLTSLSNINESVLNEDFKHFWIMLKGEGWPALSIFPTLQIWFEIDHLLDGAGLSDLNYKKIGFYGCLWLIMVLWRHITGWKQWKKQTPDEYEEEGQPGPFTFKKEK